MMDLPVSTTERRATRKQQRAEALQHGERISAELEAFAAASRARLDAIEREFPEAPAQ